MFEIKKSCFRAAFFILLFIFAIRIYQFMGQYNNNKFLYYLRGMIKYIIPTFVFRKILQKNLNIINYENKNYIFERVDYYNKLTDKVELSEDAMILANFKRGKSQNTYFLDLYESLFIFLSNINFTIFLGTSALCQINRQ